MPEKDQIKILAKLLEEANKSQPALEHATFGKCEWTDINGNSRCNSPWSEFQCEQVSGTFTPDGTCD